jgi:hypothetical protein
MPDDKSSSKNGVAGVNADVGLSLYLKSLESRLKSVDAKLDQRFDALDLKIQNIAAYKNRMMGVAAAGSVIASIVIAFIIHFGVAFFEISAGK